MKFILKRKLKFYTKEFLKFLSITIIAIGFIIAIVLIKYKPMYKVSISGNEIGYTDDIEGLSEKLAEKISTESDKNVDSISINEEPEYELKLVNRSENTEEEEILASLQDAVTVTYVYYEIAVNNEVVESVNTSEEAEELIESLKQENSEEELNLSIIEQYTEDEEDVQTSEIEVAKVNIQEEIENQIVESVEETEEITEGLADVNGITLAVLPVTGKITSRYGESSSLRKSTHTGLDISATTGTDIQVVADGTVTFAEYNGSYGNLVKVDHGNGIETWYAHTSKMYVIVGQSVSAGDVIAAVGSTGNSTGPHLHFEIRIDGTPVNPQNYLYN